MAGPGAGAPAPSKICEAERRQSPLIFSHAISNLRVTVVSGFKADQTKATLATITEFGVRLAALETGALAELSTAQASVTALEGEKTTLNASVSNLTSNLSEANKVLTDVTATLRTHMAKVDSAYAPTGAKSNATISDLVLAEINATNAALAKVGVDVSKLPAAPATAGGPSSAAPMKFKTADEEIAYRRTQAKA